MIITAIMSNLFKLSHWGRCWTSSICSCWHWYSPQPERENVALKIPKRGSEIQQPPLHWTFHSSVRDTSAGIYPFWRWWHVFMVAKLHIQHQPVQKTSALQLFGNWNLDGQDGLHGLVVEMWLFWKAKKNKRSQVCCEFSDVKIRWQKTTWRQLWSTVQSRGSL